jgi:hypothetical protein
METDVTKQNKQVYPKKKTAKEHALTGTEDQQRRDFSELIHTRRSCGGADTICLINTPSIFSFGSVKKISCVLQKSCEKK